MIATLLCLELTICQKKATCNLSLELFYKQLILYKAKDKSKILKATAMQFIPSLNLLKNSDAHLMSQTLN